MFIVAAIGIRAQRMKRLHGSAMYSAATIGSILHDYDSGPVTLTLDGETVERDLMMLSIGNYPREGGVSTNPPALNNDKGQLHVRIVDAAPYDAEASAVNHVRETGWPICRKDGHGQTDAY